MNTYIPDIHNSSRKPARGFTLIELLVVVGILLLLSTMTLLAVDFTFNSERVRSGARQLQSMLEGARDRAIHAKQPRGVRFLVENDQLNARKCSSMIYIGASETWSKGTITLMRSDFDFDGTVDNLDRDGDGSVDTEIYMIDGSPETLWSNLLLRGYLPVYEDQNENNLLDTGEDLNGNGILDKQTARIKIPGDRNGTWYNVSTYYLAKNQYSSNSRIAEHPNVLALIPSRPYRDPGTTPPSEVVAFEGTGVSTYVLELPSRVLPDAEPVLLPPGVSIDLDASKVPDGWRPVDGKIDSPYTSQMDILFSPRGTIIGSEAGEGVLHFTLSLSSDVDSMNSPNGIKELTSGQIIPARTPPAAGSSWTSSRVILSDASGQFEPKIGDRCLVSVFTQTGKVASFPIDQTDGDGDFFCNDPFRFATRGRGLTQ